MNRREFISGMCYGGLATYLAPLACFAQVPSRNRFVFVLLRGGMDGLGAVAPMDDPDYRTIRGPLALPPEDLARLGKSAFGLAPGMAPLRFFWDRGELAVAHAMAIPYRTRSHFDGQAVLETGMSRPNGAADGWLNRLLTVMEGERSGISVGAGLPRSMQGPFPVATASLSKLGALDDAYIDRLHFLYQRDALLLDRFESGLQARELLREQETPEKRNNPVVKIMNATAQFMRAPEGPNVASVEFSGWDTHRNQGAKSGQLNRRLGQLAAGLTEFRKAMGDAWGSTTVVVMTEFGRTVRANGSGGTDHGTAGAGFVLSPSLSRSKVIADWPGLKEKHLFEKRDLRPTLDTRALLKGVIAAVFDLTRTQVNRIFPGSDRVAGIDSLFR